MIKLPKQTVWNQPNLSDFLGDLYSSYNLDLSSKLGILRVSPRMVVAAESATLTNLGVPCAFRFFTASGNDATNGTLTRYIWGIAGARVFHSTGGPNGTWYQDSTSGSPTNLNSDFSDMELFNGYLYFSGATTNLYKLSSAGAWSTLSSKVNNSSGLHQLAYLRSQNRLYFVDDNSVSIGSISTGDTAASLGNQYTLQNLVDGTYVKISWIKATHNTIYIGTINQTGNQSKVYAWNGDTNTGPTGTYTIEAAGSLSCVIKNNVPVILDTRGRLLQLNGGTFSEIGRLPFENNQPISYFANPTLRMTHFNGMCLIDGKINVLVNSYLWNTNSTNKDNVPSGIWEWTKETGFYHKYSLGLSASGGTILDYGQEKLNKVGALFEIEAPSNSITQGSVNGNFLCGATYYTTATATQIAIFHNDQADTLEKVGCFTTTKMLAPRAQAKWEKFSIALKKFLDSDDRIILKMRTEDVAYSEATITWLSAGNVFSATQTGLAVGDEVEILQGYGAGRTAHITAIETSGSTYYVTIDQTISGLSNLQTGKARFQRWTKVHTQEEAADYFFKALNQKSAWIQFKLWLKQTGNGEIYSIIIDNSNHI